MSGPAIPPRPLSIAHRGASAYAPANTLAAFRKAADSNPASERIHVWLAASLARNSELDEARWEVEQIHTLNPGFSLQRMGQSLPFKNAEETLWSCNRLGISTR